MAFEAWIKIVFIVTVVMIFAFHTNAQEQPNRLYRIRVSNKYGYINRAGKVIVPPTFKYEEAGEFADGLAFVKQEDKFGYIDTSGKFAIAPRFSAASTFSEGLALVAFESDNGKSVWGYVDTKGKLVVILPESVNCYFGLVAKGAVVTRSFSEGLAAYCKNGKYGYIDKTGKTVIPPQLDYAFTFSEGVAQVRIGDKYGFINQEGEMVIKPQFLMSWMYSPNPQIRRRIDRDHSFRNGRSLVKVSDDPEKWVYIDKTGNVVIDKRGKYSCNFFSEKLARVRQRGSLGEGFLDRNGNVAIAPVWLYAKDFSEGLAAVHTLQDRDKCKDNCWGYIDQTGQLIIAPQFREAENFSGGLAWVSISLNKERPSFAKSGYIDRSGKFVWQVIEEFGKKIN